MREISSTTSTGLQKKTQKTKHKPIHNHTHHTTNMAHSPPPRLWYLPNQHDALQAHMHLLYKLGNANTEANHYAYYQTPIKDGTANGATSNAYLTTSYVPFKTKCIIIKYRTGTLYNQNHAIRINSQQVKPAPSAHN